MPLSLLGVAALLVVVGQHTPPFGVLGVDPLRPHLPHAAAEVSASRGTRESAAARPFRNAECRGLTSTVSTTSRMLMGGASAPPSQCSARELYFSYVALSQDLERTEWPHRVAGQRRAVAHDHQTPLGARDGHVQPPVVCKPKMVELSETCV
jgi:hypothetical protein